MTAHAASRSQPGLAEALFSPKSVALIGASDTPTRPPGRPQAFMLRDGFEGKVYPINPRRDVVQGQRAYASLDDVPEVPEHVYILLNTGPAMEAARACFAKGVKVVTLLADGFAESGHEGAELQAQLMREARAAGTRILGPNCMGATNINIGFTCTTNATFHEQYPRGGSVSLISQSGGMLGSVMSRAARLGVRFAKTAAVGNEADLGVGEIGMILAEDPETDVILLFLETLREPDKIAAFANAAYAAGKPVLAFKLGRSSVGQQLAVAHTGALLSDDSLADAFFRDVGIMRVGMVEGLTEAVTLCRGRRPVPGRRRHVGVITTTGGGGASVCDQLALSGVDLVVPTMDTITEIRKTGIEVKQGPLTDLTLAGSPSHIVQPTLEAMANDPDCDMVLFAVGSSARSNPKLAAEPFIAANTGDVPLGVYTVPDAPEMLRLLIDNGVPAFRTPETCADAMRAFTRWQPPRVTAVAPLPAINEGVTLDEHASLEILAAAGVPTVPSHHIDTASLADLSLPFAYPVVAKVLSDKVPHKTDAGGVIVGIRDEAGLREAIQRIKTSVESYHPGVVVERILIEPMIDGLQEVLLGYRNDPQTGPVVTIAPGGVMVGLYDDKAVRLAPVDIETAREMVAEVKGFDPLRGARNLPKGDLEGLAQALVGLSNLALRTDVIVLEAEANPVIVARDRVVSVDALVQIAQTQGA
ncbi:MAG: acetate--CoA ligase family protein [Hyphomicrobiaceae bacterium]|nr:acetate--CoA ligase family protein [Hyphomicrobiaceae bacterium]